MRLPSRNKSQTSSLLWCSGRATIPNSRKSFRSIHTPSLSILIVASVLSGVLSRLTALVWLHLSRANRYAPRLDRLEGDDVLVDLLDALGLFHACIITKNSHTVKRRSLNLFLIFRIPWARLLRVALDQSSAAAQSLVRISFCHLVCVIVCDFLSRQHLGHGGVCGQFVALNVFHMESILPHWPSVNRVNLNQTLMSTVSRVIR